MPILIQIIGIVFNTREMQDRGKMRGEWEGR